MNYGLVENPTLKASDCLILGVFKDLAFEDWLENLDKKHHGLITRLFSHLKENGDSIWQGDVDGQSLMLINCGKSSDFDLSSLRKRLSAALDAVIKQRLKSITIGLPQVATLTADRQLEHMILHADAQLYQLLTFKTDKKPYPLESIEFYLPGADAKTIATAKAIASGIECARTLANLPANICTPTYLADQATELAQTHHLITTKIMGPEDMLAMGMGGILGVAQGSQQEPRLIEISYCGNGDSAPVVLVGKGITFDSGGLSIKPAMGMEEMKYDMSGAASVFGCIKACALMNLPINVTGLIASSENLPSGSAIKPGDIITSMSGQTIEVLNTDAEGRLVLADALTYAEQLDPAFVLDIATLTGAMVIALGYVTTGFMTQDDELADKILAAAKEADDKTWRMPLDDEYQEALESPLADMINASFDRAAGAITAACFLSRYTKKYRWAHLDIAGTAWISGKKRNATGRPVPLLIQLLRHVASN
nr:leucyl aminopeptidase [Legionella jordanis]